MKTLRFFATIVAFFIVIILQAQTQQGYVKTLGRPNQKGVALSGVTIRVKGGHNAVLSNQQGVFSMPMPHKKNGDTYQLQQVQKQGYELNEQDVIGRPYAFSDKIPLTITMVNSHQLQADKQRIENKAYEVAEKTYKSRLNALEKQRDANSITIENYREQLQQLQNHFDKYQSLIDDLADHYARVDFDNLDEAERKVNVCIENGELEQADLLLQQLGVYKRVEEINRRLQSGEKLMEEANQDMALVLKQQDKDAEYLYQLYTIALAKFDNEKARFYIETRAALDTTNVEWQGQAGNYILEYIGDYKKAILYYQLALRQSLQLYSEDSPWISTSLTNLGIAHSYLGNYSKALEYLFKALAIEEKKLGKEHPDVAHSYYNIATVYHKQNNSKAPIYYLLALHYLSEMKSLDQSLFARILNDLGLSYQDQGDYSQALEYLFKALAIKEKKLGKEHPNVANSYNNIGIAYSKQGNYEKALEYLFKALAIEEKKLGKEHPDVALSYNNIGTLYFHQGNYEKALEKYFKALAIYEKKLGKEHPDVATSYNNIGVAYSDQGNYDKALEYLFKALAIKEKKLGKEHPDVAQSYNNIGDVYSKQGNYDKALEYLFKALAICEKVLGTEHPDTKIVRKNIDFIKSKLK